MSEIKQYERKYIFDELCSTCVKRVYIHCDYTRSRADEPPCDIGKALKQAYLKGSEDSDVFHSEQHSIELQELVNRAVETFEILIDELRDKEDVFEIFDNTDKYIELFNQKLNKKHLRL